MKQNVHEEYITPVLIGRFDLYSYCGSKWLISMLKGEHSWF